MLYWAQKRECKLLIHKGVEYEVSGVFECIEMTYLRHKETLVLGGIDERTINGGTWNKWDYAIWLNGRKAVF